MGRKETLQRWYCMFDLGFFDYPNELDEQGRVKNALD